ncbi:hypothetical protein Tco_1403735 [Tanacetum coccineum]
MPLTLIISLHASISCPIGELECATWHWRVSGGCRGLLNVFTSMEEWVEARLEMLKKFGLEDSKPMKTPMSSDTKLTKDEECESIDSTKYRGMIGSLLYLTASRPDIMFSVCLCARFQEDPKSFHLEAVFSIWKAFGGNTRDLGSFREEIDKTTDLHQHLSRLCSQQLETTSQITRDAVTIHTKTTSQDLKAVSECTTQPII